MSEIFGAIELGGTKTICLVGKSATSIIEHIRFPTTTPRETISTCIEFFKKFEHASSSKLKAIGIASFGPIDVDTQSKRFGFMEKTPKKNWSHVDVLHQFKDELDAKIVLDSDVNAAALCEAKLGAGRDFDNFIYLTVGTGIGGGAWYRDRSVVGLSHPEMGHIEIARHPDDLAFKSACPFHENCVEGLASGTAISKRWGDALNHFKPKHASWALEAHYLARFAHTLIHCYSPQKIIIGGGVSSEELLVQVRDHTHNFLNSYISKLNDRNALDDFIQRPKLKDQTGPLGAFLLTQSPSLTI